MKKLLRGNPEMHSCDCIKCSINAFRMEGLEKLEKRYFIALFIAGIFLFGICKIAHAETASWYGGMEDLTDPWKHTITANGEHFNENALTAASWKYPMGSMVKVTNLNNHKSVWVRINDRGPGKRLYKSGRVIDLTRRSFSKIAKLDDGVVRIKITRVNK